MGVAVVGTGFIGPVHVEGLRRAGLQVWGILGSTPDKSTSAAGALHLDTAYRDFDDVLNDSRVQSVHLATPNRVHFGMARKALQAGKHVLCEKPLAMNSSESAELVRLANRTGRAAGVNYNIRYYPLCRQAAYLVRSGELGDVFHVTGSYAQDWLLYETDFNWRVQPDHGGPLRAMADIGTHWLDLLQAITGLEVEQVCADLMTAVPVRRRPVGSVETFSGLSNNPAKTEPESITTEDYGCVMLRFAGGRRGCLWVSQVSAGRKNCLRFEIAGSRSSLAWDSQRPNELWAGRRSEANQQVVRDPSLLAPDVRRLTSYPGGHNEGFPDTFKHCFRDFYDYIDASDFSRPPTFPTFADGHREILLCEAILASHRQRGWVSVPPASTWAAPEIGTQP
jgi:predicted dehydrogenase